MKMALYNMHMDLVKMISQQQSYITILQENVCLKEKMMMIISHQMSFIDSLVLILSSDHAYSFLFVYLLAEGEI